MYSLQKIMLLTVLYCGGIALYAQGPPIKVDPSKINKTNPILQNPAIKPTFQLALEPYNFVFYIRDPRFWAADTRTYKVVTDGCPANDDRFRWKTTSNPDGSYTIHPVYNPSMKLVWQDSRMTFMGELRGQVGFEIVTATSGPTAGASKFIDKWKFSKHANGQYALHSAANYADSFTVTLVQSSNVPQHTIAWDFNTMEGWDLFKEKTPSLTTSPTTEIPNTFKSQPSTVNFIPFFTSPVVPNMPLGGTYWNYMEEQLFSVSTGVDARLINTSRPGDSRWVVSNETLKGSVISKPYYVCTTNFGYRIAGTNDPTNIKVEFLQKVAKEVPGTISLEDGFYLPIPSATRTGHNNDITRWVNIDCSAQLNTVCRIRLTDASATGHLIVDGFSFMNGGLMSAAAPPNPVIPTRKPIWGAIDMHTHPMSHLGMGRKIMHGAPDGNPAVALGSCNCNHGGWGIDNTCGNYLTSVVVNLVDEENDDRHTLDIAGIREIPHADHHHSGYPGLVYWPRWNSAIHQQMWYEWLRRARDGGLKAIIALTVNSELLARAADGFPPYDDKTVADIQIDSMLAFVRRHRDFMDTVTTSARMRQVINEGKMAVIMGMEIDNLGNFYRNVHVTNPMITAELERLKRKGIRYIFPVHVSDNKFGGAAVYKDLFNIANKYATGQPTSGGDPFFYPAELPGNLFQVERAPDPRITFRLARVLGLDDGSAMTIRALIELCENLPSFPLPGVHEMLYALKGEPEYQLIKKYFFDHYEEANAYSTIPSGHRNFNGLSPEGDFAIREMMRLGLMIDIDHSSEKTADSILGIAVANDYPVNAGHNGFRGNGGNTENSRTESQISKMVRVGGMMGVGSGGATPCGFLNNYRYGLRQFGNKNVAIGTDINGFVAAPAPPGTTCPTSRISYRSATRPGDLQMCNMTGRSWDYNIHGVAHYGLMPDFFEGMKRAGATVQELGAFFLGAENFAQMWEKCEQRGRAISGR